MTKNSLGKITFVLAVIFIALAVVVFANAAGLRRWYSGGFFLIMGAAAFASAVRGRRDGDP